MVKTARLEARKLAVKTALSYVLMRSAQAYYLRFGASFNSETHICVFSAFVADI